MPPKEKAKTESTELQVFNLDNLNPALLPELATFKEIQLKVVAENPFVKIVDTASRDLAKKYRTARVSARTALQSQDKLISSKFNDAKTKAKGYIAELIDITQPGEIEQQNEINRDEAEIELKRQEKARLEQARIDAIKKEIEDYTSQWKTNFNLMSFDSITEVSANFLESYTSFDATILQEFEALFPVKVEELSQLLSDRTVSLINVENARLEKLRIEEEAKLLAQQKAEFEAKQKLADEAEAKAKKEREDFEKEKVEMWKQVVLNRKQHLSSIGFVENKTGDYVLNSFTFLLDDIISLKVEAYSVILEDAMNYVEEIKSTPIVTEVLEAVIISETIHPEKIEVVEILAEEIPTVNVCTPIINDVPTIDTVSNLETIVFTTEGFVTVPTWEAIEKDFKSSAEKSYSKWLKDNYNPPTKI